MKLKKLVIGAASLLFLAGCSQEEVLPESGYESQRLPSTRVSISEALEKVDRLFKRIGYSATRSQSDISVEFYSPAGMTRSADDSALYYVINYGEDDGFAVVSADSRLDAIYAISDEGHLEMNDTSTNEGLAIFFSSLPKPDGPGRPGLDTLPALNPVVIPPPRDISYRNGPYLTKAVRKWKQYSPFNAFCPLEINDKNVEVNCLVGCVPLAVGMIMSHFDVPNIISWGVMLDFKKIRNAYSEEEIRTAYIPQFLRDLGRRNTLDATYGLAGTSADVEHNYKRTFIAYGFDNPDDFQDFDMLALQKTMLINTRNTPVLIKGIQNSSSDGHAWVIDGILLDARIDPITETASGDGLFVHMVWGWGGDANGWFKIGGTLDPSYKYTDSGDYWIGMPVEREFWLDATQFHKLRFAGGFKLK